jgi:hypothetical protein
MTDANGSVVEGTSGIIYDNGSGVRKQHIPTIEEAQKAAGVRSQERPLKRGEKRKPGYKPKLGN